MSREPESALPPPGDTDPARRGRPGLDASGTPPVVDPDASRYDAVSPGSKHGLPRQFGDHDLLEEIARGGMGVVYKARQLKAGGRPVALKMILGGDHASGGALERFQREANVVAGLDHPNIVPVYEVGEAEGQPFYTMPLVEGGSLQQLLQAQGALEPRWAARLVGQVAAAVQYAHDHGIVHRDVKPHNILLASRALSPPRGPQPQGGAPALTEATPRLTDFGLARTREGGQTLTGEQLGTPSYMSPEQAAGKVHEVGPAADVYALGAVLYCTLTGRPPFQSASAVETMRQVLEQEPVPVRRLNPAAPRDLETICLKCLRKDARQRYASAAELVDDLERYLRGEPIRARPVSVFGRAAKWVARHPAVAALAALCTLLTVLGFAFYVDAQEKKLQRERDLALRTLTRAFGDKLEREDWSARSLEDLEGLLAEIARRSPEQAAAARKRWVRLVAATVGKGIAAERLAPSEIARLRTLLEWLTRRDPGRAGELRETLGQRLQAWEAVFDLKPPFAGLDATFEESRARVVPGMPAAPAALVPRDPSRLVSGVHVPTRVACRGDLRLEAVLQAPSWGRMAQVGLGLSDTQGHTAPVQSVAFAPGGKLLASGGRDGTVKLWEPTRGTLQRTLRGHSSWVNGVAFHPDGKVLASASGDATVRLWEVASGKSRAVLTGHTAAVMKVAFSPDGKTLASASLDKTVRLWEVGAGKEEASLPHAAEVYGVAFAPGGRLLATGSGDGTVKLWDLPGGRERASFKAHAETVYQVAFAPDGRSLATASGDHTARLWDVATAGPRLTLTGHTEELGGVAFAPTGGLLATASDDGTARLWDAASGGPRGVLEGHSGWVNAVAFSPDGKTLATGGADRSVRVWDAVTGRQGVALRQDGYAFLLSIPTSTGETNKERRNGALLQDTQGHTAPVQSVAFAAGGKLLASGGRDGTVKLWEPTRGTLQRILRGHSSWVNGVAFHPNGKVLASASGDATVRLWEVASGKSRAVLTGHTAAVMKVAFSPDGKTLASASLDKTVRLWRTDTGKQQTSLPHGAEVYGVAFAPGGRLLATGSEDGTVKLWDLPGGRERASFKAHETVYDVAFAPDGRSLATASGDHTARLWDVATAAPRATLAGHTGTVNAIAFAPSGGAVATASDDGTVRLWDATGAPGVVLEGHSGWVRDVAFHSDGKTLASGGKDHGVRLWDSQAASLAQVIGAGGNLHLRILLNGVLSQEQWVKLPPDTAGQPLRLTATVEDDRLTFQVNELAPLSFREVFPPRRVGAGVFSVYWPDGVRLERLRASSRRSPPQPSLLEQGDEAYVRGRFSEALARYETLTRSPDSMGTSQEVRCKAAFCLLALGRLDQAADQFTQLVGEQGPRWPAVAACQLWVVRLRQKRLKEADAVLVDLTSRYRFEDLAPSVSVSVREEILRAYELYGGYQFYTFKRRSPEEVQRLLRVQELFGAPEEVRRQTRLRLVQIAHEASDGTLALKTARELLHEPLNLSFRVEVLQAYVWLQIGGNQAETVRAELDRSLALPEDELQVTFPLFLERARVHVAAKRWVEAEKDLERWFKRLQSGGWEGYLLQGFLLEQRGDSAAAVAAWRKGYQVCVDSDALYTIESIMLGSLGNVLSEADAQRLSDEMAAKMGYLPGATAMKNALLKPEELALILRATWRSPRGRAYARKAAFGEMSRAEMNSVPAILFLYEVIHQGSLADGLSKEQDELLWSVCKEIQARYAVGALTEGQIVQLALSWASPSYGLSWTLLSPRLPSALRGPLAYFLGLRRLKQKAPAGARPLFRTARADAPSGSPLHRLAQAALDRLGMKSPLTSDP